MCPFRSVTILPGRGRMKLDWKRGQLGLGLMWARAGAETARLLVVAVPTRRTATPGSSVINGKSRAPYITFIAGTFR